MLLENDKEEGKVGGRGGGGGGRHRGGGGGIKLPVEWLGGNLH